MLEVAGPAALLVAKAHKIGERLEQRAAGGKDRTQAKDAHDVYRLLKAVPPDVIPAGLQRLLGDPISAHATEAAIGHLRRHAGTPDSALCLLAGQAEEGIGDPSLVSAQTHALIIEALSDLSARDEGQR